MSELMYPPYVQTDGTIMRHYVCDTTAERDALGNLPPGSTAYCKDTDVFYTRKTDGTWASAGGGPGGEHPDLAAHNTLGLATQAELDTVSSHNHDAAYSASGHTHAGSQAFPVGSVFIGVVSTNPGTLLGYGTWSTFGTGRVLVGIDPGQVEFDTVEETGGAKTHVLQTSEIPSHTHVITSQTATTGAATSYEHGTLDATSAETEATEVTGSTGGGFAHNNLQPYIVVYMWKRTA